MDKKEQELRQKVADLKAAAEGLMGEGKQEEAKAKLAEAKAAKTELDNYLDMQSINLPVPQNQGGGIQPVAPNEQPVAYKQVFFKALRGQKLSQEEAAVMENFKAALSENTGEDGGYVVPEDIQTAINELKNTVDNLEQYVNVQPVKTNKGARTLERRADSTPFAPLSEYGNPNAMAEIASPKFDRLAFAIDDYAGFLPVPNDLLADTDQALEQYLRNWIAKKSKATRNSLILAALNALPKAPITGNLVDGIKKILNVTLDPAFSTAAKIYTNQDGFNYLDTLKDSDGNYMLEKDITSPSGKAISGRPVIVLSNKTITTAVAGNVSNVPFIVGDLKEAVVLWDRQQLSIDMTKEGGNAWRTNTTEFRAIEREDVTLWDDDAVVYAQFDINPA
jgi:HK97 family phage major capsid protein